MTRRKTTTPLPSSTRTQPTPDAPEAPDADRHTERRRNRTALLALLAVALVFGFTRRDALRERWLEAQSMERLRDLAQESGADPLTRYAYARRLADAAPPGEALGPATRAVEALSPVASPALAVRVLALAGYVAAQAGEDRRAEAWLERGARIRRDDPLLFLGSGIVATHQGRLADAVGDLTTATQMAPSRPYAWSALGTALLMADEPARAIEACRQAISLAPRDAGSHAKLAQALRAARRYAEASAECRTAAELAPQDPNYASLPAILAAHTARTEAEYDRALAQLRALPPGGPQQDRIRSVLACLHLRFGRCAAARAELETVTAHAPSNAVAWDNLATACTRLGDQRAADAATAHYRQLTDFEIDSAKLRQATFLRPADAGAYLRLADLCRHAGRFREAAGALEQAQQLRPGDPQIERDLQAVRASLSNAAEPSASPLDGIGQN